MLTSDAPLDAGSTKTTTTMSRCVKGARRGLVRRGLVLVAGPFPCVGDDGKPTTKDCPSIEALAQLLQETARALAT